MAETNKRAPIGVELVRRGLVSQAEMERAIEYQRGNPRKKIGDILNILDIGEKSALIEAIGERNKHKAKQIEVTKLASPVLPPAATPDAHSTKVVTVDVPQIAPDTVAMESQAIDLSMSIGSPFSSSIFASEAVP